MQPVLTQVPPKNLRSMTATFIPAPASLPARDGPACPVPMMIASCLRMAPPPSGVDRRRLRHLQTEGEHGCHGERHRDAGDARGPAEAVEQLAQDRRSDETSEEVRREVDTARRT